MVGFLTSKEKEENLRRLMENYGHEIKRICYVYLKEEQLAQDATQDTFWKAYQSYEEFEGRAEEKTWLTRIAINTCKNYLRTAWLRRVLPGHPLPQEGEETLGKRLEQQQVTARVLALPTKYREVVLLYYYQGYQTKEIAQLLHLPQSTISTRLRRAKEQLRAQLKGWWEDEEL